MLPPRHGEDRGPYRNKEYVQERSGQKMLSEDIFVVSPAKEYAIVHGQISCKSEVRVLKGKVFS